MLKLSKSMIAASGLMFVLSACRPVVYNDPLDVPGGRVPLESRVQLHQQLYFQPGYSRSFVQSGKALTYQQLDRYQPFCQFYRYEPPKDLETLRSLQPDTFRVTKSFHEIEFGMAGISVMISFGSIALSNSQGLQNLSSVLKLASPAQPEIVELRCSVYDEPLDWNYLSVNQIKAVLGNIATLELSSARE
mgnify:CR=1 FL=1